MGSKSKQSAHPADERKDSARPASGRPGAARPGTAPPGSGRDSPRAPSRPRRRSFSQRVLDVESQGPLGDILAGAFRLCSEEGYLGTHRFHPYPGRFHHALPGAVLAHAGGPGMRVLDPFMGGGTTLVEAMGLGMKALGNDLNPIALLVARERTRPRTPAQARLVDTETGRLAVLVEALRREKRPPRLSMKNQHRLAAHYQPHLLAEMMQWLRLIEALPEEGIRETLRAVFSSAAVKFSNLASDSQAKTGQPPGFPKGAVTRFLVSKSRELTGSQQELARRIPEGTPPPRFFQEDARLLPSLGWEACDLVFTSPPYPGTYDYHAQHSLRMDWLELDGRALLEGEIGPRRSGAAPAEVRPGSWSESFRDVLGALARITRPGGDLFFVMGDWISADHPVDAGALLTRLAERKGWRAVSRASVRREVFSAPEKKAFETKGKRGKWEHLLHFTRAGIGKEPARKKPERKTPGRKKPSPR